MTRSRPAEIEAPAAGTSRPPSPGTAAPRRLFVYLLRALKGPLAVGARDPRRRREVGLCRFKCSWSGESGGRGEEGARGEGWSRVSGRPRGRAQTSAGRPGGRGVGAGLPAAEGRCAGRMLHLPLPRAGRTNFSRR